MNTENLGYALEIMGKGMASIFLVIIILTLIVVILGKVTNMKFKRSKKAE